MPDRPNIVLLFTDQQRHDTIRAAGFDWMKTPNMDRLVEEGCLFPNAYSSNPVCMPARHDLLTGQTARAHGYYANQNTIIADHSLPTIPRTLSDNGYATAAVGKMHFRPVRRHHGFTEMHLMEELPGDRRDDAYATWLEEEGLGDLRNIHGVRPHIYHVPQRAMQDAEHHGTQWVGRRAARFIDDNKDRPFFLMAGWIKPHPPWNVPEDWDGLYRDAPIPEPDPVSREYPYYAGETDWCGDNDPPETKRAAREAYLTCVSMVDQGIGFVLDALERNGLADNTLVILTSDHGEMLYDKGMFQKAVPYDSAARVPMVMRWPERFQAGSRDERFVDLLDLFPTMLDAAGAPYPDEEAGRRFALPGASLLPGADQGDRDRSIQWSCHGRGVRRWALVRDARYKYVYFYNQGTEHLYDMQEDPGEVVNLVSAGRAPADVLQRLRAELVAHESRLGPPEAVENGQLVPCEGQELSPEAFSKHPLWSNNQFQTFGKRGAPWEPDRFVQEAQSATAPYNAPNFLHGIFYDKKLDQALTQGIARIGGTVEDKKRVTGR